MDIIDQSVPSDRDTHMKIHRSRLKGSTDHGAEQIRDISSSDDVVYQQDWFRGLVEYLRQIGLRSLLS